MTETPFWLEIAANRENRLRSGPDGLASAEIQERLRLYGPNRDPEAVETGPLRLVLRRGLEPMSLLLAFAALVSVTTGDAASALIILVILSASIGLDLFQEGRAKRAAEALRQAVAVDARVKRDGIFKSVPVETVVPGDVFEVDVGDIVPADAMILTSSSLTIDEAALTGNLTVWSNRRSLCHRVSRRKQPMRCFAVQSSSPDRPQPWWWRRVNLHCSAKPHAH